MNSVANAQSNVVFSTIIADVATLGATGLHKFCFLKNFKLFLKSS